MERSQINYDIPDEWLKNRDKGLCPVCAKTKDEFEKGRKVYCGEKCAKKFQSRIITWNELRDKVLKRDGKLCAECGDDEEKINEQEKKIYKKAFKNWKTEEKLKEMRVSVLKEIAHLESLLGDEEKLIEERGIGFDKPSEWNFRLDKEFQVDHIVAIVNGGEQWDEKNLQVLCAECHKKKTSKDMKKRTKGNKQLLENNNGS